MKSIHIYFMKAIDPPRNFLFTQRDSTRGSITWTTPANLRDAIHFYNVTYCNNINCVHMTMLNKTSIEVDGLILGSLYHTNISAIIVNIHNETISGPILKGTFATENVGKFFSSFYIAHNDHVK